MTCLAIVVVSETVLIQKNYVEFLASYLDPSPLSSTLDFRCAVLSSMLDALFALKLNQQ